MPKVRSLVVALLPLAVALTAFGCAASTTSGSSSTPDESKVIVVGCDDFSPFTYNDESGNLTGIDVEIISEACRRIGYEARCTFIDWEQKDRLLASGDIDCIASCFSMAGRESKYRWAGSYMTSRQVVAVSPGSDIQTLDDLAGKLFTIADNGMGMSEGFQRRLFEPFAREEQNVGSKPSGTGLGLAIAKQLVELMDGEITCESELGRGTTFAVVIPFRVADEKEVAACEAETQEAESLLGVNVLLAEDNELNREIAEFVITDAGATLCVAENGKEAVELFETMPPGTFDVVLMDIMMPVMNGYEAAQAIRELSRADAKTIPIIALSANAFADDRQRSSEAGMNAHLAKPLEPEELVRTIAAAVRLTRN